MEVQITRTTPVYRSPEATGVFIQYIVTNPPTAGIKKIKLERAGSPDGPFELVIDGLTTFHFFDSLRDVPDPGEGNIRENLNFLSLSRGVYYKVTAYAMDNSSVYSIREVGDTLPRRQALLKRKMQRDIRTGFKFNSVPVAVIKRKHWGVRCNDCFDRLTKTVTQSKCNTCFGTGFAGGYHTPVRVSGRLAPRNINTEITVAGKADTNQIQLIILDYPALEEADIVVTLNTNERYYVNKVTRTELRTVPVHQEVLLSEVARDAPEYRVLINLDHIPIIY